MAELSAPSRNALRDGLLLGVFAIALAALTRAPVWPLSVTDWDESLYLLMGRDVLAGRLPYDGIFDHKPAGLYYQFALAQVVFGQAITAIRMLAIVACATTALFLGLYVRRAVGANFAAAVVVGALYLLLSMANGGLATNTEILINAYLAVALWLSSDPRLTRGLAVTPSLCLGLVFGFMVQTNYLAGVFVLGFCAAYALALAVRREADGVRTYFANGALIFAAFLLASGLTLAPIAIWGDLPNYLARQGRYLSGYGAGPELWRIRVGLVDVVGAYGLLLALMAAIVLGFLWTSLRREPNILRHRLVLAQMLMYAGLAVLGGVASGRLFAHYFLLMLPMLTVSAAVFLANLPREGALRLICSLWLVLAAVASASQVKLVEAGLRSWMKTARGAPADTPAEIAKLITPQLKPAETIYAYDYDHVLYYQAKVEPPTKYPFREHHLAALESAAVGIKPAEEMQKILAHRPRFVAAGTDPHDGAYGEASAILARALDRDYRLVRVYDEASDPTWLYERRTP